MLRRLYICMLRLHPRAFRQRFADEMLSIFDQAAGNAAAFTLLLDGFLSLARQWGLRPQFWRELSAAPSPQPASDAIPSFQSLDPFRPRAAAVIHGVVLSTAVFCLTCFAIRYSWIHVLHIRIPEVQSDKVQFESPRSSETNSGAGARGAPEKPVVPRRSPGNTPALAPASRSALPNRRLRHPVLGSSAQSGSPEVSNSQEDFRAKRPTGVAGLPEHRRASSLKPSDLQPSSPLSLGRSGRPQSKALQPHAQDPSTAKTRAGAENKVLDSTERQRVIQAAAANLTKYYIDPDVAQKMADSLTAHEKNGDDDAAIDGETFAGLLTKQMQEVSHDQYVMMVYSAVSSPENPPAPAPDEVALYRKEMEQNNCTVETIKILPHNIGYMKLNAFPDASVCRTRLTAAMSSLNTADAVIFDLRDNRGGYSESVALIATYLFDRPTHLNDFYDRGENSTEQSWTLPPVPGNRLADKPVFVLTSHTTFSAAEGFSYDLKMLKRATLVGETTSGRGHMGMGHRIDDQFTIRIPGMKVINPISKTNWEGAGVEPDVKVKAEDALQTALKLAEDKRQK